MLRSCMLPLVLCFLCSNLLDRHVEQEQDGHSSQPDEICGNPFIVPIEVLVASWQTGRFET